MMEERIYPPMHPGRVLEFEFLKPLQITPYARTKAHHRRYGFATCSVLRDLSGVLAKPAKSLRSRGRGGPGRGECRKNSTSCARVRVYAQGHTVFDLASAAQRLRGRPLS